MKCESCGCVKAKIIWASSLSEDKHFIDKIQEFMEENAVGWNYGKKIIQVLLTLKGVPVQSILSNLRSDGDFQLVYCEECGHCRRI